MLSRSSEVRGAEIPVWVRARGYTEEAIKCLVGIMRKEEASDSARHAAATALLDRGWGRAPMIVAGDSERPIRVSVDHIPAETRAAMESALRLALAGAVADALAPEPEPTTQVIDATVSEAAPEAERG